MRAGTIRLHAGSLAPVSSRRPQPPARTPAEGQNETNRGNGPAPTGALREKAVLANLLDVTSWHDSTAAPGRRLACLEGNEVRPNGSSGGIAHGAPDPRPPEPSAEPAPKERRPPPPLSRSAHQKGGKNSRPRRTWWSHGIAVVWKPAGPRPPQHENFHVRPVPGTRPQLGGGWAC